MKGGKDSTASGVGRCSSPAAAQPEAPLSIHRICSVPLSSCALGGRPHRRDGGVLLRAVFLEPQRGCAHPADVPRRRRVRITDCLLHVLPVPAVHGGQPLIEQLLDSALTFAASQPDGEYFYRKRPVRQSQCQGRCLNSALCHSDVVVSLQSES